MKKIFTLIALLAFVLGAMAQGQYFYEWKDGKYVQRSLSEVDSITFSLPESAEKAYKYVDLGLPSGTLWADRNVGADSPEGYGDYFAWGETAPKSTYNWSTYKWCRGSSDTMIKYCTDSNNHGTVDNKTVLDLEDDAAYVNMGPEWRMPTKDELYELMSFCTWVWTTQNGTLGHKVTGPNGNSIFLPAAGCRYDSLLDYVGSDGYYWSSSLDESDSDYAWSLYFGSGLGTPSYYRFDGRTVRAVVSTVNEEPVPVVNKVDLGLPSGTLWADRNVGADSPEAYGDYFAWGETAPKKSYYDWSTYKWCKGSYDTMTKYCTDSSYGTVDTKTVLDPEDDAAYVNMGKDWRMPTYDEQKELRNNCAWTWTTQNGTPGYKVTGPNGNSIFLPAAGDRYGSYLNNPGSSGYYWSSSLIESYPDNAWNQYFRSGYHGTSSNYRDRGFTVRAVVR